MYFETEELILDLTSKILRIKPGVVVVPELGLDEDEQPDIDRVGEAQAAIMLHLNGQDEIEEPEITVELPTSVKKISYYAFGMCENIREVVIPDGSELNEIGRSAFYRSGLKKINLEKSKVTKLERQCFHSCELETIILPETLNKIGELAFWSCHELTRVVVPDSLQRLGDDCFVECSSLKVLDLSDTKVEIIPDTCFAGSGLETVLFPRRLKRLGNGVFESCHFLKEVEVPELVTHIGNKAFSNCRDLKLLKVHDTLRHVDPQAIHSDTFLFQPTDLLIDMGMLNDNRHEFPVQFASFIPFERVALLDLSPGNNIGTCRVERVYKPNDQHGLQRIIHCRDITEPVILATLTGENFEVDISTSNLDDSLKLVAKIQNDSDIVDPTKSVPKLPSPTQWDILLHTEDNAREDITVQELMNLALNDPNFDYSESIMISFLGQQSPTGSPVQLVATPTGGPASVRLVAQSMDIGGPPSNPTIIITEATPSPATGERRRRTRKKHRNRRTRKRKKKGKSKRKTKSKS